MLAQANLGIWSYRRNADDCGYVPSENEAAFIGIFRIDSLRFEHRVIESCVEGKAFARRNAMIVTSTDRIFRGLLSELVFDCPSSQPMRTKFFKGPLFL
jgi:hypothetical protein